MRLLFLPALFALSCMPVLTFAADVEEQETVQEPDAEEMPDDDVPPNIQLPDPPTQTRVTAPTGPAPGEAGDTNFDTVLLQGLNKVTARAQELEAPIGSVIRYGTIEIIAHKCWKSAPENSPENAALLEVSEIKQGEKPQNIFWGWMFSSTPALSSLEHPFYDVSVMGCRKGTVKP